MRHAKVAIVTGANQGLRLAQVRGLCCTFGTEGIVCLTARDRKRGEQAVGDLEAEGLSPRLELLDVRDGASVKALADAIGEQHGGMDNFISNAAVRISRAARLWAAPPHRQQSAPTGPACPASSPAMDSPANAAPPRCMHAV